MCKRAARDKQAMLGTQRALTTFGGGFPCAERERGVAGEGEGRKNERKKLT